MSTSLKQTPTAILLAPCPDRQGIVAALTAFLCENQGNIVNVDQHVDSGYGLFFMRIEQGIVGFKIARKKIASSLEPLTKKFSTKLSLYFSGVIPRIVLFVTKDNHCLYDLLSRHEGDEGPAIDQGVTPVSRFVKKSRALEQSILSRAVWLRLKSRALVRSHRTLGFG